MKPRQCRQIKAKTGDNSPLPPSRRRRGGEFAAWLIPGVTLILLPKCPVCIAAYVALFTGIGISIASASVLRTSLLVLCIAVLLCLLMKRLRWLAFRSKARWPEQAHASRSEANG